MNRIEYDNLRDFDLDHIFDCGQCFRFEKTEEGYMGVAGSCLAGLSYKEGRLSIDEIYGHIDWDEYLDLNTDYGAYKSLLSQKDDVMKKAISMGEGIRILNQDPWETLISFIISQNNNIPRIKKCIEGLCTLFGDVIGEYEGKTCYAFPTAEKLSKISRKDLNDLHLGYRDEYILDAANNVDLDKLYGCVSASAKDAYDYLIGLKGVGPKVANCILLFSMKKRDSFPIDVWVKRVMHELYGFEENDIKGMADFAKEKFGDYGGIAQQYLFRYMRWHQQKIIENEY